MSIEIAGIIFDRVRYDTDGDVLYLPTATHRPRPNSTPPPRGHALRFDADGQLVGVTLLNARWLLDHDGEIKLTASMPEQMHLAAEQLQDVLVAA